jgi:predicted dehydrogenase
MTGDELEDDPTMLTVGIIGAGGIGRVHAEAYQRQRECRVGVVADVDPARGTALANDVGAHYVGEIAALLASDELQAVSICLPHALHADAAVRAAQAGKHVLCEKPIATTLADADRMIAACAKADVSLMIGFTHRFYPEHRRARQLLQEGAIGRPLFANDVIWSGRDDDTSLQWRGSVAFNGGGIFMDNGIHSADRLRWWLESEVDWVTARVGPGRRLVEGEEHGTALLGFANGITATLQQALGTPRSSSCCYAEFVGTEGVIRVDTWQGLRISRRGAAWEPVTVPPEWPRGFDAEIGEFVAAIRENRRPAVTGEDGRAALAIIQAIYRAAESASPVKP